MDTETKTELEDAGQLSLIGIRVDPNHPEPDFYTILLDDRDYWPITYRGQIILFQQPEAAQTALDLYLQGASLRPRTAPAEVALVYDFSLALHLLSGEPRDESCTILNVINLLLDMVQATAIESPALYKSDLCQLADHLTFNKELGEFLDEEDVGRGDLVEAVQWAFGAAMTKAMFVPKPGLEEEGEC